MKRCVCACLLVVAAATISVAGPQWELSDDSWMKLSFLGQVQGSYTEDAANTPDVFLRRGRFILAGQLMDGARFFVETDNDNLGKTGVSSSLDIQDAFIDVRLAQSTHWIKAGLILLPFSFENHSSAASLLGLDYNSEVIKLANTFVWRDYGVAAHGNIGTRFAYVIGAFDGNEGTTANPDGDARFTGHLAFNLLGNVETGWFNSQDRLGGKGTYLSVGVGADVQDKASLTMDADGGPMGMKDNAAFVADFQSGYVIREGLDLTVNGAWYEWDNARFEGSTAFVEAGLRKGKVMGTAKASQQDSDSGSTLSDYTVGAQYFMKGHNLRAGLEYRWGDSDTFVLAGLQFLL